MPRPRRSTRSTRGRQRPTAWHHAILQPTNVTSNGQASVDLLAGVSLSLIERATLVRTVGTVMIRPADASSQTFAAFGLAYVQNDAGVAGALPDPATDVTFLWLHWQTAQVGSEATGELATGQFMHFQLDIRAKRRMRDVLGELRFIIDNLDGTNSLSFAFGLRLLFQLR